MAKISIPAHFERNVFYRGAQAGPGGWAMPPLIEAEKPDVMDNSGRNVWAPELLARRPDLNMGQIGAYLYRVQPDFVDSVSRDFARSCKTPMLVINSVRTRGSLDRRLASCY